MILYSVQGLWQTSGQIEVGYHRDSVEKQHQWYVVPNLWPDRVHLHCNAEIMPYFRFLGIDLKCGQDTFQELYGKPKTVGLTI